MLEAEKLGIAFSESSVEAAIRTTISSTLSTTICQPTANAESKELVITDMKRDDKVKPKKSFSSKPETVVAKNALPETKSKLVKQEVVHARGHPNTKQPMCNHVCEPKVSNQCKPHGNGCSLAKGHDSQHMCWPCRQWTMKNPLESSLKECVKKKNKKEKLEQKHKKEGGHMEKDKMKKSQPMQPMLKSIDVEVGSVKSLCAAARAAVSRHWLIGTTGQPST